MGGFLQSSQLLHVAKNRIYSNCFHCNTFPPQNQDALDKVYGPLKERYIDRYGGFVRIVKIPHPPNSIYPRMAYVEFVDNKLPPMPELPVIEGGRMRVYSKQTEEQEHCEAAVAVG